jgi:hypothetical protein
MPVETIYETVVNVENPLDYPKMYKVIKEGDQEYARVLAEFSDAPEGVVSEYISIFKSYVLDLVESIPEVDASDREWDIKVRALISAGSYLRGAMPALVVPLEVESEEVESD